MTKVFSFQEFVRESSISEGYGALPSNLPPGYREEDLEPMEEPEDRRNINPSGNTLKVLATDLKEFAILKGPDGKRYIFSFDAYDPEFIKKYTIYGDSEEEELEMYYEKGPDLLAVETAANDVPKSEIGFGNESWQEAKDSLIEIDRDLAKRLVKDFGDMLSKTPLSDKRAMLNMLDKIQKMTNESLSQEISEGKGIHPAIREKLMGYLKENPDATYAEAKKFISEKIAGWKLTQEDFEEAKKMM
jgi:hypothetical protein